MASRIAARSTTAGTPVKSCMRIRAGLNAISTGWGVEPRHPATASTSSAETETPSSLRRRFSSSTFSEYGSRPESSASKRNRSTVRPPPSESDERAPKLFEEDDGLINHHFTRSPSNDFGLSPYCVGMLGVAEVPEGFSDLQARLPGLWPAISSMNDREKSVVVVSSISLDVPSDFTPLLPAYEERYLFLLLLLRQPRTTVVYTTSTPVHPRLVDYYLSLVPGLDGPEVRSRLHLISTGDPALRPLAQKLLDQPQTIEHIRHLLPDVDTAHLIPFVTTDLEARLAVELGIPMYGACPSTAPYGTKSGGRRIFAKAGVPHPTGVEDVHTEDDVVEAIGALRASNPALRRVFVKLDRGVSGLGNGEIDVDGVDDADEIRRRVRAPELEAGGWGPDVFFETLAQQGGVVEEELSGPEIRSPSVQMRITPLGEVELLSTHDQVLGGSTGRAYLGGRFPADPSYSTMISHHAIEVGRRLARLGVLGRFAVDFVVTRRPDGSWDGHAIEINLRKGGTTHPFLTLQFLTDGVYDWEDGTYRAGDGSPKFYVASDHVHRPNLEHLTPDEILDRLTGSEIGWNHERQTGSVFHMLSALPVVGQFGLTAIGNSMAEADRLSSSAADTLERWAGELV